MHAIDASGQLVAQSDGVPAGWTRPTATWREGELIVDAHALPISADIDLAQLTFYVGLYDERNGERLRATWQNGDPIENNAVPMTLSP
ncbi:MAG: hypothetical protein ACPG8W_13690 [Candidatus Promineifilaceae bacterium]